jgi:hypothetical protein
MDGTILPANLHAPGYLHSDSMLLKVHNHRIVFLLPGAQFEPVALIDEAGTKQQRAEAEES